MRLLADDPVAIDFLHLAVGIRDDPVSTHQRRRYIPGVRYGDRVGEYVAAGVGLRLVVDIAGRYFDIDFTLSVVHGGSLT
jgi:hypothetical protein